MSETRRPSGYRAWIDRLAGGQAAPSGMGLGPHLELSGDRELTIWRHAGLLEYGGQRVLVLSGRFLYEIEGSGLTIAAMSRDMLCIRGTVDGVRLVGARP